MEQIGIGGTQRIVLSFKPAKGAIVIHFLLELHLYTITHTIVPLKRQRLCD
jgi:hypothetical protein